MKKAILAALYFAPSLAFAAAYLPLSEEEYTKNLGAQFDAVDKNQDGFLDKAELAEGGALAFENPFITKATQEACAKTGQDMATQFKNKQGGAEKDYKVSRKEFIEGQADLFEHVDTNDDKTATQLEADVFNQTTATMCGRGPELLQQMQQMQMEGGGE